jgi:hypothetical protein
MDFSAGRVAVGVAVVGAAQAARNKAIIPITHKRLDARNI